MKNILEAIKNNIDLKRITTKRYFKGELLNLANDKFYILKSGNISIEISNKSFNEFKVIDIYENELIAPLLAFENMVDLPVSIVVKKDSEIISVTKKEFFQCVLKNPADLEMFFSFISKKTNLLFKKLLFFTMTIEDKFLQYLHKNKNENNIVVLGKSITDLSKEFFITRPSMYKIINQLIGNKIIEKIDGKTFKIL